MSTYISALLLFLPAGVANAVPVLVKKIPVLDKLKAPIDGGMSFRGKRLLGANKTWRGLFSGTLVAGFIAWLLYPNISIDTGSTLNGVALGCAIGFGALLGDAVESFFKRQKEIPSGSSWLLFDQLDYVMGALLFSLPFVRLAGIDYLLVILTYFVLHFIVSYVGYLLGLKDKPI
ncbi:MAG: CDP-archaeol synthase [Candidatus Saccharibacteria bacterium]|nr:CDP-archaeol synthase [Candidatus Saccharibacteria bacterium]